MTSSAPAFDEIHAPEECPCAGCLYEARTARRSALPGHRAARAALVAGLAGGVTLVSGAGTAFAADSAPGEAAPQRSAASSSTGATMAAAKESGHGQGAPGPLFGASNYRASQDMRLSREQIIARAQVWANAKVPYSMSRYWSDGYRMDCSGFVSMAWGLRDNQWTGSLASYGVRISKSELQPGDMLLFHNSANPVAGSHVVIFGGWANSAKTQYIAYDQTRPHTLKRTTPYAYWNNSAGYVAYRYKNLSSNNGGESSTGFPGADKFGPGANNQHVTELGRMLVQRGGGSYYTSGPGPRWSDADRKATQAFQRAQGWTGSDADGIPGKATWDYLKNGKGRNINAGGGNGSGNGGSSAFPGVQHFRPGAVNAHVNALGVQLVKKGFGKHYSQGPGERWTESDRRNVEAFQRAQGWSGSAADGYPGPETWRRLFA
ncbi:peptidoglycan-binding protein [Streptomyces venezuelae]|uniref:peptidoglycan-binding protein n=1 Tax=Streptomyces venezuelae TaxID=54571 RepID=UPI001CC25468|nr:peptidoglycan-binding protein [Streptomyces venezuelae]